MAATATKSKPRSKVSLQPIGDKVVVERDESEERTAGGIVLSCTKPSLPTWRRLAPGDSVWLRPTDGRALAVDA